MNRSGFSRRGLLKGLAVGIGAAAGTRLGGAEWIGRAMAAPTQPTTVVLLHLVGGYNALFGSADGLVGRFGVQAGNFTVLGNGLAVDNTFNTALPAFAKAHMATIGVRHGLSNHEGARAALWTQNGANAALQLASALGGTAAIKAASVGGNPVGEAPTGAVNGVSFQAIRDMKSTIDAMGGGTPNPRVPDREIALAGMTASQTMSKAYLASSPKAMTPLGSGYATAVDGLKKPVKVFNFAELSTAYGLNSATAVNSFKSKIAAAELMAIAGANVVSITDGGWDTHGDTQGTDVRNKMTSYVLPPIATFCQRMLQDPDRNVIFAIMGDFSRSLPGSDHQPNLSVTVMGKLVKQGTTGKVDNQVRLPTGTPSIPGLWAYLGAISKAEGTPFGANPHALVL